MSGVVPLDMLHVRTHKENAIALNQQYLNIAPSFQRAYEAWDNKMKTRLIETILLNRAMNPIWTVINNVDGSEEVLDGMHRLKTALNYFNNEFPLDKKFVTLENPQNYSGKYFRDLSFNDQTKIRKYNFNLNTLDSSYRTDLNKLREMYEILNRSSRPLNDYEFNKVLQQPFYNIITDFKGVFSELSLFRTFKDNRGKIESEIEKLIVLSSDIPASWSSMNTLINKWKERTIGVKSEEIQIYVNNNKKNITETLNRASAIIKLLESNKVLSDDTKIFRNNYIPYLFIVARMTYHFKNVTTVKHYVNLIDKIKSEITGVNIQTKLGCSGRNSLFQGRLIKYIDKLIEDEINTDTSPRFFPPAMIDVKLKHQNGACTICNKIIKETDIYQGDHIVSWTAGGKTIMENLQVLHVRCHELKHS